MIDFNNNIWSTGLNNKGQLGLGDINNRNNFELIDDIKALDIGCGNEHSIIIDIFNNVLVCGDNGYGQLGLDNLSLNDILDDYYYYSENEIKNINYNYVINNNDLDDERYPLRIFYLREFNKIPNIKCKSIACGGFNNILIDMNNEILTFGLNIYGNLNQNINLIEIKTPTYIYSRNNEKYKTKKVMINSFISTWIDMDNNLYVLGNTVNNYLYPIIIDTNVSNIMDLKDEYILYTNNDDNLVLLNHINGSEDDDINNIWDNNLLTKDILKNIKIKEASFISYNKILFTKK